MALLIPGVGVRQWCFALLAAALLLLPAAPGRADEGLEMAEQKIMAGMIYNLLKYVDWPPDPSSASSTTTVCIFGDDPFAGSLQPIARRTVNQRQIDLQRVAKIQDTQRCQLLFVNASERQRWPELSAFLAGKSVLTVSDLEEFAGSGGMVEFGRKNQHIDVAINMTAVATAGLHVQDRLLKLAHVIPDAAR
jgi:hypothetical protein